MRTQVLAIVIASAFGLAFSAPLAAASDFGAPEISTQKKVKKPVKRIRVGAPIRSVPPLADGGGTRRSQGDARFQRMYGR